MTNAPHNIDAAIAQDMNARMNQQAPVQAIPEVSSPTPLAEVPRETEPSENLNPSSAENLQTQSENDKKDENKQPEQSVADSTPIEAKETAPEAIDEYGNPIAKPRMYTEDELNQKIRERLSRGRHAEHQPTHQQTQQAAKDFAPDPNSDESWEVQLDRYIDRRIDTREKEASQKQWEAQEAARQSQFEEKFTTGMSKYNDFHEVLTPLAERGALPNSVMMATRALENPAAFLYGAAKMHPQELERISRIADPATQAVEVGRLHERMVKAGKALSSASKPIEIPKGDLPAKSISMPSLEQRIAEHARSKRRQ